MKSNRWVAFISALAIVGCRHQNTAERSIQASIATKCHRTWPCAIDLRGTTAFEWDTLYVFKYTASKADIENATKTTLSDYKELTRYLAFQQAGKVVLIESEPTNVEHPIKGEVVFDMPDSALYQAFPASTEFIVTRESSEEGPYFLLKPK